MRGSHEAIESELVTVGNLAPRDFKNAVASTMADDLRA